MSVAAEAPHKPVMLREVIEQMAPEDGKIYVDATFGAGGYSRALLESAECRVYAIDRDPNTVMLADALARDFPGRFLFLAGCFGDMLELLATEGIRQVDGIVMDLGVSSMQLDEAERGFSFSKEGPLDMRMQASGVSADVLVNTLPEQELADIIYTYGEEKASRAIARAIVAEREHSPIHTTGHLADIVRRAVKKHSKTDPATKTFQALRIQVNDELGQLESALHATPHLLQPGGKLIVVSFHSLEDRIVKQFLRPKANVASRHAMAALVEQGQKQEGLFDLPFGKAITADDLEIAANPRARSAKMRVGVRTHTPVPEEA